MALKGFKPANKIDRTGRRYGRVTAVKDLGSGRWECLCDCGNTSSVLSTNLSHMAKGNMGCRNCGNRKTITGERRGLLTALHVEAGTVTGRPPLWTFQCDCGNTVQGTVREFHANWLRSCGCRDSTYGSWCCMMGRCYNEKDERYHCYGARGITVCKRWHRFENFVADMGERPKRHNLGRKHAERGYCLGNCQWEHVSQNCRDTKNNGQPTASGLKKGAKPRILRK